MNASFRTYIFAISLLVITSCSFNYTQNAGEVLRVPDMLLEQVLVYRYESAELSVVVTAAALEMYDSDRVWAGSGVSFIQYEAGSDQNMVVEGNADFLIVDEANTEYTLAGNSLFHAVKDNIFLRAAGLRWQQKKHLLVGLTNSVVEIEKADGSVVSGTGFISNTLDRRYSFTGSVSGLFVTGSGESVYVESAEDNIELEINSEAL